MKTLNEFRLLFAYFHGRDSLIVMLYVLFNYLQLNIMPDICVCVCVQSLFNFYLILSVYSYAFSGPSIRTQLTTDKALFRIFEYLIVQSQ